MSQTTLGSEATMRIEHPTDRPNFSMLYFEGVKLWFSYETLVGVRVAGKTLVAKNAWGPTTGKHLNYIDNGDKETRIDQGALEHVAHNALNGSYEASLTDLVTAAELAAKALNPLRRIGPRRA